MERGIVETENNAVQSKEQRINYEYECLLHLFRQAPKKDLSLLKPLLENASFMKIALEDLQKEILDNGYCENYKNGANQYGMKQGSSLQAYNTTIKNYTSVMMKLLAVLPHPSECEDISEIMSKLTEED